MFGSRVRSSDKSSSFVRTTHGSPSDISTPKVLRHDFMAVMSALFGIPWIVFMPRFSAEIASWRNAIDLLPGRVMETSKGRLMTATSRELGVVTSDIGRTIARDCTHASRSMRICLFHLPQDEGITQLALTPPADRADGNQMTVKFGRVSFFAKKIASLTRGRTSWQRPLPRIWKLTLITWQ